MTVTYGRRGSTDDLEDGGMEVSGAEPILFFAGTPDDLKSSLSGKGVTRYNKCRQDSRQ